jgi:putative ABC transport system permease protein
LLGGDLVVIADHPVPPLFKDEARREKLAIAETLTFPSMVSAPGGVNLAEIKAVSDNFPLRGRLRVAVDVTGGRSGNRGWAQARHHVDRIAARGAAGPVGGRYAAGGPGEAHRRAGHHARGPTACSITSASRRAC